MEKDEVRNRRHENKGVWLTYVGDFPISTKLLSDKEYSSPYGVLKFIDALLRGYGQVVFANNPFSGFLIAIALTWANPSVSLIGLFTASIALAVSIIIRLPKGEIDNGLTVFNCLLLGLVSGGLLPARFGIEFETKHWVYLSVFTLLCVFVSSALGTFFESIKPRLLCFALPFNIVQFLFFVCVIYTHKRDAIAVAVADVTPGIYNVTSLPVFAHGSENVTIKDGSLEILDLIARKEMNNSEGYAKIIENLSVSTTNFAVIKVSEEHSSLDSFPSANDTSSAYTGVITDASSYGVDESNDTIVSQSNHENNATRTLEEESTLVGLTRKKRYVDKSTESNLERNKNATKDLPSQVDTDLHWGQIFGGIILSMSQAFGVCHVPCSLLMYLGVLVCSPITAAFCVGGATLGTLIGIVLSEAPYSEVYEGVWGFNGLLSAGALGGFCYIVTWQSTATVVVCVVFTTVLQRALMIVLEQSNFPVISIPFNLSAILFLCVTADARRLPRPDALTFPEKHLYLFRRQQARAKQPRISPSPSPKAEKKQEEDEKRAPLAEQEVV